MSTSPQAALKAAKQLVGCYPHARPPEPETYAAAIASVLAQYPLGVVHECADPRTGLAREREFPPTVAAVISWCDKRLAWHQAVASYVARPALPQPKFTAEECQKGKLAQIGLKRALRGIEGVDPKKLTFEDAAEIGAKWVKAGAK